MERRLVLSWLAPTLAGFLLASCSGSAPGGKGDGCKPGQDAANLSDTGPGSDVFFPTDTAALSVDTQQLTDLLATTLPFARDVPPGTAFDGQSTQPDARPPTDLAPPDAPAAPDSTPGVAPPSPDAEVDLVCNLAFTGGDVSHDLTLTKACSPYSIKQRIVVKNGAILTIEPGVSLRFSGNLALAVGQGSPGWLVAEGTAADPITMTSAAASPVPGDWVGVTLYNKAMAGSSLKYVRMDYCGATAGGCIDAHSDGQANALSVDNVTINHVGKGADGIREDGDGLNFKITNTTFPAGGISKGNYAIHLKAGSFAGVGTGNMFNDALIQMDGGTVSNAASWINPGTPIEVTDAIFVDGPGAVLTIAAGTILQFGAGIGLWVGESDAGQLVAVGTDTAPIVFTSGNSTPGRGDWDGIHFWDGTADGTKLAYAMLDYCGSDTACIDVGFGLKSSRVTIDHVSFDHVGTTSNAINEANFSSRVAITNCTFAVAAIPDGQYAISLSAASFAGIGSGNVFNGALIEVSGGKVTTTTNWVDPGTTIVVTGDINVDGANTPVLTIGSGMTFKFDSYCALQLGFSSSSGKLVVEGKPAGHVTFTSLPAVPAKSDWYGILLFGNSQATLAYADISYAGGGGGNPAGGVVADGTSSLTMANSTVKHNAGYGVGIACDNPNVTIDMATCTFEDNTSGDKGPDPNCR